MSNFTHVANLNSLHRGWGDADKQKALNAGAEFYTSGPNLDTGFLRHRAGEALRGANQHMSELQRDIYIGSKEKNERMRQGMMPANAVNSRRPRDGLRTGGQLQAHLSAASDMSIAASGLLVNDSINPRYFKITHLKTRPHRNPIGSLTPTEATSLAARCPPQHYGPDQCGHRLYPFKHALADNDRHRLAMRVAPKNSTTEGVWRSVMASMEHDPPTYHA